MENLELDIWQNPDIARLDMSTFPVKTDTFMELRKTCLIGPHYNDDQQWGLYRPISIVNNLSVCVIKQAYLRLIG